MSFFHPSSHPLNPFGTGRNHPPPFFPMGMPPPPPPPPPSPHSPPGLSSSLTAMKSEDLQQQQLHPDGAKKKIYVRTDDEQFALPLSKVETNEGLVSLLSKMFGADVLYRLQIRYDTTVLDGKGNPVGPICGGAMLYPEYWESLVENGMRILIKLLPEENNRPPLSTLSQGKSSVGDESNHPVLVKDYSAADESTQSTQSDEIDKSHDVAASTVLISPSLKAKENHQVAPDRAYAAVARQGLPLGVSTNSATNTSVRELSVPQVRVVPDQVNTQKIFQPGKMSAMTAAEAAVKSVTDPYSLTYQSCITLLAPMLPDFRRLTHPRLSPNIVTIRPCHENTLWIFCVVQHTLHPVTVRAFETIDIEELILRVVPPEMGKERVVVLWRNMKFGGESIGPKYNAKKETRGTGGRNMWKRNLAVLAVKNAEVFVVVYEQSLQQQQQQREHLNELEVVSKKSTDEYQKYPKSRYDTTDISPKKKQGISDESTPTGSSLTSISFEHNYRDMKNNKFNHADNNDKENTEHVKIADQNLDKIYLTDPKRIIPVVPSANMQNLVKSLFPDWKKSQNS
ncbi:hypothetical protein V1514DRAFT_335467 [Lipomyces japonicus]|uniref:uncharacterized protein n=1 Tax=Lipomyces japonicus TaxID=56871 RepID=UPI0034CFE715